MLSAFLEKCRRIAIAKPYQYSLLPMKLFLSYWFWPNPGAWHYHTPNVAILIAVCVVLIVVSFLIRRWRAKLSNPITKQLTGSWSPSVFWFGVVGLVLTASRVESIQFLAMRALWILWLVSFGLFVVFQIIKFRRRHYTVIGRAQVSDERDKYLPRRKK